MARSGLAKGKNKGHITQERELKAKPSSRKGVRTIQKPAVCMKHSRTTLWFPSALFTHFNILIFSFLFALIQFYLLIALNRNWELEWHCVVLLRVRLWVWPRTSAESWI